MKKWIKYGGKDIIMKCVEMSHASAGGEYEIVLSEKIELDLDRIREKLENSGYELEKIEENSISLFCNNAVVTVLRKGGMLIEDLNPDTFEEAVKIGEEILNAGAQG